MLHASWRSGHKGDLDLLQALGSIQNPAATTKGEFALSVHADVCFVFVALEGP